MKKLALKEHSLSRFAIILATLVFVYLLVFKFPFTPLLNESDHHMFLYEGMRLFDGDAMYRDFFQFTFPGSQAWYWLMFSVFGAKYWILPATIVLISGASVWVCLKVSSEIFTGKIYVIPALLYIFFGFRYLGLDGAHRMFSPVFVMLAIFAVIKQRGMFGCILAGAFCAIASFFTQQRGVLIVAAIGIFLVIDGLRTAKTKGTIARSIAVLTLSFTVVITTLCCYFLIVAGPNNFIDATIVYPAKYYRYAIYNNFDVMVLDLTKALHITSPSKAFAALPAILYLLVLPVCYLIFWTLFLLRKNRHGWEYWRNIMLIAISGSLLTFTNFAPNPSRLFQIAMPGLIIFVWLTVYFKDNARFSAAKFAMPALASATILVVVLSFVQATRLQFTEFALMDTPTGRLAYIHAPIIDQRYGWLLKRTSPGDYVFEAYQPYIYFPLRLRNPTKYGQIWDTDYTRPEHVTESIDALIANPPRYILWNNDYNKAQETRSPGDHIGPLSQYLQTHYKPANEAVEIPEGKIQIWEKTD